MTEVFSLEEIAERHIAGTVLLDTNMISLITNSVNNRGELRFYLEVNPETIVYCGELFNILKRNPNLCTIKEVNEEFYGLLSRFKGLTKKEKSAIRKIDLQTRNCQSNEKRVNSKLNNIHYFNKIEECVRNVQDLMKTRQIIPSSLIYLEMKRRALDVAKNIHLFSPYYYHSLAFQRGGCTTDECLVASAFAHLFSTNLDVAVVTRDRRIQYLGQGIYETLFSREDEKNFLIQSKVYFYEGKRTGGEFTLKEVHKEAREKVASFKKIPFEQVLMETLLYEYP